MVLRVNSYCIRRENFYSKILKLFSSANDKNLRCTENVSNHFLDNSYNVKATGKKDEILNIIECDIDT